MSRRWSLVAVVVSAACFGTLAVLIPLAYQAGAEPLQLLAWRFSLAAVMIGVAASIKQRRALAVPLKDLGRFALLAITGYGAASICFAFALLYADASVVAVLLYAYPALILVAEWALGARSPSAMQVVAVAVTFAGCALVVGLGSADAHAAWQGVVLGLGAAVGYATFSLLSHRWLPGRSSVTMMTYIFGFAVALPLLATLLLNGADSVLPFGWSARTWWLLLAIAVVPTFAAVVLYFEGIRGLGPSQAAIVSTLEPPFTMLLAAVFLGERLGALQLAGAGLVLVGVATAEIAARAVAPPAPS